MRLRVLERSFAQAEGGEWSCTGSDHSDPEQSRSSHNLHAWLEPSPMFDQSRLSNPGSTQQRLAGEQQRSALRCCRAGPGGAMAELARTAGGSLATNLCVFTI